MVRTYRETDLPLHVAAIDIEYGRDLEHRRIVVGGRQHAIHGIALPERNAPKRRLPGDMARSRLHRPKPSDGLVDR